MDDLCTGMQIYAKILTTENALSIFIVIVFLVLDQVSTARHASVLHSTDTVFPEIGHQVPSANSVSNLDQNQQCPGNFFSFLLSKCIPLKLIPPIHE